MRLRDTLSYVAQAESDEQEPFQVTYSSSFWFDRAGHSGHSDSLTSLDCHPDNTLILSGSTDVTAKLINTQTGKVWILWWLRLQTKLARRTLETGVMVLNITGMYFVQVLSTYNCSSARSDADDDSVEVVCFSKTRSVERTFIFFLVHSKMMLCKNMASK